MKRLSFPLLERFFLASSVCCVLANAAHAQTLKVVPTRVLVDEVAMIRAEGLAPNERVSIQADLVDGANEPWAAQAEFVADAQGVVDTSKQAPVKGSYNEVSPMGLVWSMKPNGKHVGSYRAERDLGAQMISFELLRNGQKAASAQLEQLSVSDGVKRVNIEGQLHGVLLVPAGEGPHPGVLVVGGSEGGMPLRRAAWLASHGYTAVALAYFRYENLPHFLEGIPLEYFRGALGWMMRRQEISSEHIAVVGTSRGGELALQLGSMFPDIKAVVAYVPANVRFPACCGNTAMPYAWTWQGEPLAFVPRGALRNPESAMEAAIAVEHTHGPILMIAGEDDGVWESSRMTDAVVERLKRAHFAYACERLSYRHAGHRAGRPEIVPTWHGVLRNPTSGREENLGGNSQGDAESSLDAIPKVLDFLRQSLGPRTAD